MFQKTRIALLLGALILSMLAGCAPSSSPAVSTATPTIAATSSSAAATPSPVSSAAPGATSVAQAPAASSGEQDDAQGDVWDGSGATRILLNENSIATQGQGVSVDGSKATITSPGTYVISGSLSDGQLLVNSAGKQAVRLVLDGVRIHNSQGAAIAIMDAGEALIVLADNSENYVSDGASYVLEDPNSDEPNAALFSKADLTISGNGSLTVDANYNDGIASKDGLVIHSGTIHVVSVDDGIRGKDYLVIRGGAITIEAGGDGFKSDNEEDATRGYITIESGVIKITCGGDAIQAVTNVLITDGELAIVAGGGSNSRLRNSSISTKGVKAGVNLTVNGGLLTIDSADDALHSNDTLIINGGTFVISTGDDALHADKNLEINGGDFTISTSYEGIESAVITINDGTIRLTSSDDGINASAGRDASGANLPPGGRPGRGGGPGQGGFMNSGDNRLYINGGYIFVNAGGDGIDANGAVEMTGGVVIVNGPTQNMNGALDHASFKITGGLLVAAGSAGMAQAPDASSSQHSVLLNLTSAQRAGTSIRIQTNDGREVLTFAPTKQYQSVAFSSSALVKGATYEVLLGGSSTGTVRDGLYEGGTYTGGSKYTSFAISGVVTRLGSTVR